MNTNNIRDKYNENAAGFDRHIWAIERLFLNKYRERLVSQARGKTLEIAVGTGVNLPYYDEGCDITGIDISEGMLAEAKKVSQTIDAPVTLVEMDAEKLSFDNDAFDTVLTTLSLCTIIEPESALVEMKRVLKPDGVLLLIEHVVCENSILHKIQDILTPYFRNHLGCNLNRDTVGLIEKAGFKLNRIESRLWGIFKIIQASKA